MKNLRAFVLALWNHWVTLMSSAVFTLLGYVIAVKHTGNEWLVTGTRILAAIFVFVAAYKAWVDEHEKWLLEYEKNRFPKVRAEAFDFERSGPANEEFQPKR